MDHKEKAEYNHWGNRLYITRETDLYILPQKGKEREQRWTTRLSTQVRRNAREAHHWSIKILVFCMMMSVMIRSLMDEVLPVADFLYLAVPQTNETIGLIDKKRLDMLKTSCGIVNIGRETVLDYKALCEKLKNNEIAGAILDVFSQEPIPKESELWDTPNLIITPHVSSDSEGNYVEMVLDIFFENLKLFLENKELNNLIDKKLGY